MNIIAVTAIQSPISESHSCWWHARCSRWPRNKNIQNSASRNQSVRTRSSWKQNVNKQAVAKVVIFCPQSEKCTLHIMRFPSVHLNSTYSHFPIQYPNKTFKQPEKLATEDAAKNAPNRFKSDQLQYGEADLPFAAVKYISSQRNWRSSPKTSWNSHWKGLTVQLYFILRPNGAVKAFCPKDSYSNWEPIWISILCRYFLSQLCQLCLTM